MWSHIRRNYSCYAGERRGQEFELITAKYNPALNKIHIGLMESRASFMGKENQDFQLFKNKSARERRVSIFIQCDAE